MDTFKLLTCGAKFDNNKFKKDFHKFQKKSSQIIGKNDNEPIVKKKDLKRKFNVDQYRNDHGIIVDGDDIKPPIRSFEELKLVDYLKNNIKEYEKPTPIQMQVIPLMLDQRQVIACAPTGSGKTLSFLLPIIVQLKEPKSLGFRAIILAPTRELAKQIHRESLWISNGSKLRIHLIKNINLAEKKFNPESKLKYDILITTPKRLEYLLKKDPPSINIKCLEWLIIDECDRLFQSTFLEQLSNIFNACFKCSSKLKLAMFSATYDPNLHEWCKSNLNNIATIVIGERNKVVETIEQKLIFTGTEAGKLFALKEIIQNGCSTPVLIFVNTVRKANYLERELEAMGLSVEAIHSDRNQEYRDKIVRSFREGKILFLICTELMGRGIDFKAVNLVINYDLPSSMVSYIHHIGRTGRAGRHGTAITFYSLKDERNIIPILDLMKQSGCDIPEHLQNLDKKKVLLFEKMKKQETTKNGNKKNTKKRKLKQQPTKKRIKKSKTE